MADELATIAREAVSTSDRLRESKPSRAAAITTTPPEPSAGRQPAPLVEEPGGEAPPDTLAWYRAETEKLLPRFEAAEREARDAIAQRGKELAGFRQRIAAAPGVPEPPELPEAPKAPKITARPFLESVPGEPATQSLNKALAGLGLLTQMAVGIKGGFPSGALAAYTGALHGWKAGDLRRGSHEWQNYMGELQTYDRDVRAIRAQFEDAIRKWGADQERLGLEFGIIAAEHNLGREATELAFRAPARALEQVNTTAKLLSDMELSANNIALRHTMWLSDRELKLLALAQKERELGQGPKTPYTRQDIENVLLARGFKPGTPEWFENYANMAKTVTVMPGGQVFGAPGLVPAGPGYPAPGPGQVAPGSGAPGPLLERPPTPEIGARYMNRATWQAPPADMTLSQIQQSGDYVQVPAARVQALGQGRVLKSSLEEAEKIIMARPDLFPVPTGDATADALAVAKAKGYWGIPKIQDFDADVARLTALQVAIPAMVKSFGDTANVAVKEREITAEAAGFHPARQNAALARIDLIRRMVNDSIATAGFPPFPSIRDRSPEPPRTGAPARGGWGDMRVE